MHFLILILKNSSGVIREVRNLGNVEDVTPLEDYGTDGKSPTPAFGSVITVKGVLKKRPKVIGDIGTLLIGDDPRGAASSFTALRIVIQSDEENTCLRPYTIKTVLEKMRIGTEMAIKGRVDVLEENDLEKTNTHCEMLKFKLELILLIIIFLRVIQIYTKLAKFARLYFLQFTTFHNQNSQF